MTKQSARKTPGEGDQRRGYHHGHLREALIDAARDLIAENGPQGFTLADAAKRAGVSAAAPYRHFKDKKALLEEVARQGFRAFTEAMTRAFASGGDSREGFVRMGRAYLDFAREEPGYYAAVFASGLSRDNLAVPGARSGPLEALERAIVQGSGRIVDTRTARLLALEVWALSHGIASLSANGELAPGQDVPDPTDLLAHGVNALVTGALATRPDAMGAGPKPKPEKPPEPPRPKKPHW